MQVRVRKVPKADIGRNRASERSVSAASTDDAPFMRLVKIFLRCGYRLHIRIIAIFALKWNPGFDWRPWIPASTRALKNTASDKEWEACVAEEPCARVPRRFPLLFASSVRSTRPPLAAAWARTLSPAVARCAARNRAKSTSKKGRAKLGPIIVIGRRL